MKNKKNRPRCFWFWVVLLIVAVKAAVWWYALGRVSPGPAELEAAPRQELSLEDAAGRLVPSVVRILAVDSDGAESVGSGFALAENILATSYHTLEGALRITVTTAAGEVYPAWLVGHDCDLDLALLFCRAPLTPVVLSEPFSVSFGEPVSFVSLLDGMVEIVDGRVVREFSYREGQWFILSNTLAVPGHSGSPLFSRYGEVVGMVSFLMMDKGQPVGAASAMIQDLKVLLAAYHHRVGVR